MSFEINKDKILDLISKGEGLNIEFKKATNALNRDVYDTVCAFLNRSGGHLIFGVKDDSTVQGVDPNANTQMKKEFVTTLNNPTKINPPTYLSINDLEIDGHTLLYVYVPESSQVHRCNGKIYDRNEDGDLDITNNTKLVHDLYLRKQATYSENKIYSTVTLSDLRKDLIDRSRKLASIRTPGHPWESMNDDELIRSAQLYKRDIETGSEGISLAGILLLGKDDIILSAVPHHRTDLILRIKNLDRYDDRDLVTTNLIETYDRIMHFAEKYLPDPFYLEGDTNVSLRQVIFREVASNILIHREYTNAFPAKLIIGKDSVTTENSNIPHTMGILNLNTFTPYPKNPVIANFFRNIGRADELGSGMRNLMKYGKIYGGQDPEMSENDIFKIKVYYPTSGIETGETEQVADHVSVQVTEQVKRVLVCLENGGLSTKEMMKQLGLNHRPTFLDKYLKASLSSDYVEMSVPDKPKSPIQKYRLTASGKSLLGTIKGELSHPVIPQVIPQVTPQVTPQVEELMRNYKRSFDRKQMQETLGLKDKDHFRDNYLNPAIENGYIEMTIPDKPTSPKQKYRITDKGRELIRNLK